MRALGRIEVADLTWRPYGRIEPVLRDLTLSVPAGQRVLLVGPSGSGKSTLLRALAGLLDTADAGDLTGSVSVDGAPPTARPGTVGLVLQEPGAGVVAATVGRDVAFGLENIGMPSAAMPPRVASAVAAVGLADELALGQATPTATLSGGQTQRLAMAGALALEPTVLLLDEPTAMLDAASAVAVRTAVDALTQDRALTLVVVEHVLGPWVDLVDRVVVLDASGRITADGPVREVLTAQRERLLDMGIWVPGAGAPAPLAIAPGLLAGPRGDGPVRPGQVRPLTAPLLAQPLVVTRATSTVDGITRSRVAARTAAPLAPPPGTLVALVGPSGSGKSTVLQALAGFLRPVKGTVQTRAGADPAELSPRDLATVLAWIPQWASSTVVTSRVLDEVLATSRHLGRSRPDDEARARALLAHLGLAHLADADPRHLSGGELRRLAVAAAVHHGPEIVLADEPTIGQDRHTWAAVVGLLAAYRATGGAIIAATHDSFVIERAAEVHTLVATDDAQPTGQDGEAVGAGVPWLAGRSPLALLLGAALAVPAGVLSPTWRTSLLLIALQLGLALAGVTSRRAGVLRPARTLGVRLVPGLLAAVSVAWSTWLLGGHRVDLAATGLTRVILIVLPSAVLLPFIDTARLADDLGERLRLPDRPVVAVAAALQRGQDFGVIWDELARARRVRALGPSWRRPLTVVAQVAALTFGLLIRSLRAAAELAVAMDARGFATAHHRTWAEPSRWRGRDTLLVAIAMLPLLGALLSR